MILGATVFKVENVDCVCNVGRDGDANNSRIGGDTAMTVGLVPPLTD